MKLYVGNVIIDRLNEMDVNTYVGWYSSQNEALGDWISQTKEKHPNRPIVSHAISDITHLCEQYSPAPHTAP